MTVFDKNKKRPVPPLRPTVWDAAAAAAVAALALVLALWGRGGPSGPLAAEICVDGAVVAEISLPAPERRELSVSGRDYTLLVAAEGDAVWVASSDCPGQDCVHTGRISRPGQGIVCLPGRVSIRLEGGSGDGVDAVVG